MSHAHRVVILGGGFGGLQAAKSLKSAPVEVTILDRRNYHLFQPLLYQVATGSLSPAQVAAPIRGIVGRQKNTEVLLGEAVDIDPVRRRVHLRDGANLEYDSLIVATGSESFYYGHDPWRGWAPSLKSIEEATIVRHKILYAFEAAERASTHEEIAAWLTFVIVGGGATGLELAGALAEIARKTLKGDFRRIRPEDARIVLMEGAPRVLPTYPEDLSAKAEQSLRGLGVDVRTGVMVTGITRELVTFKSNDETHELAARTVLWAGGITIPEFGRKLAARTKADTDKSGRIKVQPDLTIPGYPEIFVVGDLALSFYRDGRQLPGVAQVAIQGGEYAAKTIQQRIRGVHQVKPFHYFDKGDMAVIGRASAVANIFGVHVSGLPAWLVWLFVHLFYLIEFQNRILVFIQWGFLYFTFSRTARLITGRTASDLTDEGSIL